MLAIEKQRATRNLPCVKNCYFPHAGDVSTEHFRSSSFSNVTKAVTAFLTVNYLARATRANVTKRLLRKIKSHKRHANCWNVNHDAHCPRWVSPRVPSLKEDSLAVIPLSVYNGCMIEIHVRYRRHHSSEIVKTEANNESEANANSEL